MSNIVLLVVLQLVIMILETFLTFLFHKNMFLTFFILVMNVSYICGQTDRVVLVNR